MVQPDTENTGAGSFNGSRIEGGSSDSNGGNEPLRFPEDSSTTTDDCMSNPDDDSDAHSLHSRQDSLEDTVKVAEMAVNVDRDGGGARVGGGDSGDGGGGGAGVSAVKGDEGVVSDSNESESSRQKRTLVEEGQGALLRKACDLCTKVIVQCAKSCLCPSI